MNQQKLEKRSDVRLSRGRLETSAGCLPDSQTRFTRVISPTTRGRSHKARESLRHRVYNLQLDSGTPVTTRDTATARTRTFPYMYYIVFWRTRRNDILQ